MRVQEQRSAAGREDFSGGLEEGRPASCTKEGRGGLRTTGCRLQPCTSPVSASLAAPACLWQLWCSCLQVLPEAHLPACSLPPALQTWLPPRPRSKSARQWTRAARMQRSSSSEGCLRQLSGRCCCSSCGVVACHDASLFVMLRRTGGPLGRKMREATGTEARTALAPAPLYAAQPVPVVQQARRACAALAQPQ